MICDMEVKLNNTAVYLAVSNASQNYTVDNGKAMVGLWEAKYVLLRVILCQLNVYFLPALICIGKHLFIMG